MTDSNKLPTKCMECAKANTSSIHQKCNVCIELEFQESILGDLNRCIQDKEAFKCHAFQPVLSLVSASENRANNQDNSSLKLYKRESYLRLFHSEKIKYERALAMQMLGRDPDGLYVQIKYHLSWNVTYRMLIFNPASNFTDLVHGTFLLCSERIGGFVDLLHLAPDHVHLYVESNGELSVDEIVSKIKGFSNNAIMEKFPSVKDKLGGHAEIWDEAYFAETIG